MSARGFSLLVAAVSALVAASAASPALGSQSVITLGSGQARFWSGTQVDSARVADPSLCGTPAGACLDYKVRVAATHAKALRAALESADESNDWGVALIDPAGHQVASGTTYMLGGLGENFDVEVWAPNPVPGVWTVRVVPENVRNGDFQMRVALDPAASWPRSSVPRRSRSHARVYSIPPDLAADAPWGLTFTQPTPMLAVETGNVLAGAGLHHASATVAGQPLYDCLPEETVQQRARRCLRFSSGFASLGPGRFEVYGSSNVPVAVNGGPLYQRVYRSDGSYFARPAGAFIFHQIHAHYHVLGIATFYIYRVLAGHRLLRAGSVLKEGFCLGNVKIFDWHSFAQSPIDPNTPDNCEPSPEPDGTWRFYEGIAPGWEDVYVWQTSGQFVDFADNPSGRYLLRLVVNPYHLLLEADSRSDHNDVGYTYFTVTGDAVHVLERGRGTSPWDPHKKVEDPVFGER